MVNIDLDKATKLRINIKTDSEPKRLTANTTHQKGLISSSQNLAKTTHGRYDPDSIKNVYVRCSTCYMQVYDYLINKTKNTTQTLSQQNALSLLFLLCVSIALLYFWPLLRDIFTSHDICLTFGYNSSMWTKP